MRQLIWTTGLGLAFCAAIGTTARAESIARESISPGFLTGVSSNVVHGRAQDLQAVGDAHVLTLTRLADLKGASDTTLRVLVRASWQDVKAGDEFVGFLRVVDGEAMGLGAGTWYTTVVSPFYGLVRVTDANRAAWLERVQVHVSGSPAEVIHRCASDVQNADRRIAGDALVDLWHQRGQDLAGILSSQEKSTIAATLFSTEGWERLEGERVHGLIVLGAARATEAYAGMLTRLAQPMHPDTLMTMGMALGQIDRTQATLDLSQRLTGTPEQPTAPEEQLRILAALRGMAAPETLPAVQSLFTHGDANVRRWAMVTAGYVGAEPALTALVTRLQEGTGLEAWCAAFALHRSGGTQGWAEVQRIAAIHGDAETRDWLQRFVQNPAMRGQDVLVQLVRGY